jgi:Holliday junction resolvasome RuvABC endonuclease subunit
VAIEEHVPALVTIEEHVPALVAIEEHVPALVTIEEHVPALVAIEEHVPALNATTFLQFSEVYNIIALNHKVTICPVCSYRHILYRAQFL